MSEDAEWKLVANERIKLTATYLNTIAAGFLIIGFVAPIFSFIFALPVNRPPVWVLALGILSCQCASGGLHLLARWRLKGLKP